MKTETKIERLQKWACHLSSNEAPVPEGLINGFKEYYNESEGCWETQIEYALFALKGMEKLFPEYFQLNKNGNPVLKESPTDSPLYSIIKFFDIGDEVMHLLVPGAQQIEQYGGKVLTPYVTGLDIAFNLKEMIKRLS